MESKDIKSEENNIPFYIKIMDSTSKKCTIFKFNRMWFNYIDYFNALFGKEISKKNNKKNYNEYHNVEENAFIIHCNAIIQTEKNNQLINTELYKNIIDSMNYIIKYFSIWNEQLDAMNYIKKDNIQSGIVDTNLLDVKDLNFIQNIIDIYMNELPNDEKNKIDNITYKKYQFITSLRNIIIVASYLGITSLKNKLNVYIASLIWKCNMLDISNYETMFN